MSSFRQQLATLLAEAKTRGLIDPPTEEALLALSAPDEQARGMGSLALTISVLGAFGLILGIILLLAANWWDIPVPVKLGGFLLLFLASHGAGLLLRWKHPDYAATAESFTFLGGGLFLGGLALVSQTYHINADPARGVAAWFIATLPLAVLLLSTPLMVMALTAGVIWLHLKGFVWGDDSVAVVLAFETALAAIFIGGSAGLCRLKEGMGRSSAVIGGIVLAGTVYFLGFFRYLYRYAEHYGGMDGEYLVNHQRLSLFFGAAVMAVVAGYFLRLTTDAWTNRTLAMLLLLTLLLAYLDMSVLYGMLDAGAPVHIFSFGQARSGEFRSVPLFLTVFAWALWFLWGLWLVWEGTKSGSDNLVTAGVYCVAAGLVTRYFDIIGTLAQTGAAFIAGGVVLILCGWGAEKWRRTLKKSRVAEGA